MAAWHAPNLPLNLMIQWHELLLYIEYFLIENAITKKIAKKNKWLSIQHGYQKCGTHAQVFSQTCTLQGGTARIK